MTRFRSASSQRYMLSPEFKPVVLELYQQVRTAVVGDVDEARLQHLLEARPEELVLQGASGVSVAGQLRGIALATCSSIKDLLSWARTPDRAELYVAAQLEGARRIANLNERRALERYELAVSKRFEREFEVNECDPLPRVQCEGCEDNDVYIYEDGMVSCSSTGIVYPFEWLPVVELGRRALVCSDCAAEAHALKSEGFARLLLEEFRGAIEELKEARRADPDNETLYEDGALVAFYRAAMETAGRTEANAGAPRGQPARAEPRKLEGGDQ